MSNLKPVALAAIIDDDASYEFALKRMLTLFGIAESVISFPDGKEAFDYFSMVQAFPSQIPDMVFLDINMPNMNGWEFLDRFSKIKPQLAKDIRIYMLSSSISCDDIEQAKSYPEVSDYLTKPAMKQDLIRVLEEVQSLRVK